MVAFVYYPNLALLIIGIILVGFSYGTLLSVFPSLTADLYGLKNYGTNYGILYLAWGLAGVVAPMLADYFYYRDNNFFNAYIICAGMMVLIIVVDFVLKRNLLITRHKTF
jgi:MFS family permease